VKTPVITAANPAVHDSGDHLVDGLVPLQGDEGDLGLNAAGVSSSSPSLNLRDRRV
jgi:hypothetical protein